MYIVIDDRDHILGVYQNEENAKARVYKQIREDVYLYDEIQGDFAGENVSTLEDYCEQVNWCLDYLGFSYVYHPVLD